MAVEVAVIHISSEFFPIVCFQALGESTPGEVAEAKRVFAGLYGRRQRFVNLTDARRTSNNAAQRKLWAEWTQEVEPLSKLWTVAAMIVLDSAIQRGALTAINWVVRPVVPQHIAATPLEGAALAEQLLRAEGVEVPPGAVAGAAMFLERGLREYGASKHQSAQG